MQHDSLFAKAQRYLRSAALLLEMEDYDSSVSRAYFAMFYSAQAILIFDEGALSSRQTIRSAFRRRYVETGILPARAGDALNEAAYIQEIADYGHESDIDKAIAERILQEAEAFVNSLARMVVQYA